MSAQTVQTLQTTQTLLMRHEQNFVLLRDASRGDWLCFRRPLEVIKVTDLGRVCPALEHIQRLATEKRMHAAGFISYEAAPAFDPALRVRSRSEVGPPLLWFGVYERIERVACLEVASSPGADADVGSRPPETEPMTLEWSPSIPESGYRRALDQIRGHLRVGNCYQVNFTFRLRADFSSDPWDFFLSVCRDQPAPHAAYVRLPGFAVCSFSPERFFVLDHDTIISEPMKGTRPRGRTLDEDLALAHELSHSVKDQAENVMITDMVRNDLGRIAETGSVGVDDLCRVEKHATVWQMVSTVRARTKRSLTDIFAALFPPASITGAPKAASMGIIADLESAPRGLYTGCVGYVGPRAAPSAPGGKPGIRAAFNVAIRTVVVDRRRKRAEYGVGGGIVWDSNARGEYAECRIKAEVLHRRMPKFRLLETMLWTPEQGYVLLERHLARLAASAEYFDYSLDMLLIRDRLDGLYPVFGKKARMVRLLLDKDGFVTLEHLPPPAQSSVPHRVALATTTVESQDIFLYHKTTHRHVYAQALAANPGFDDVLLQNERGELTESTRANLAISLDGVLWTPPIRCGLLGGTTRAEMVERGELKERVLRPEDLRGAERVILLNSVRGVYDVMVEGVF
ncbi:aminodeoxychorismate synthase component I [Desulfonatronum thioautotrophicum]|uniref:aminodeoxychorismate synthase component I n=1 Tax=Desulfonatronum thioautotrophicum TaxID=617001 RepID=UPI00069A2484|nr:aminodeoxychorismate synthase component I [Desulfonatronum thioautotrophicum]